jgi:putative hydrolase of the HAD superfamily
MINTVVFDIGDVLVKFRWEDYLKDLGFDAETCERMAKATVLSNHWVDSDRGILSDEQLIASFIKSAPDLREEILLFFDRLSEIAEEYAYAADWVKSLKSAGYRVLVLSNYGRTNFGYGKEKFNFLKHIDGGVISYEIHKIKPEPEIYINLITKYDLDPSEAVFIDDRADNIEKSKEFGFQAIQFQSYEQATAELSSLGVNV